MKNKGFPSTLGVTQGHISYDLFWLLATVADLLVRQSLYKNDELFWLLKMTIQASLYGVQNKARGLTINFYGCVLHCSKEITRHFYNLKKESFP